MATVSDDLVYGRGTFPAGSVTLCGCIGGSGEVVPVRVHSLIFVLPLIACLGVLAVGGSGAAVLLALVATGPGIFGTVLVHEIGHLVMASRCGATPTTILLWPLGGLAISAHCTTNATDRIWIAAAGPATHVPMCLFWIFLTGLTNGFTRATSAGGRADASGTFWFETLFVAMFFLNVYLFVFNALIPCFPLDCSAIVMNTMLLKGFSRESTAACMCYTSAPIVLVLAGYGLWAFFTSGQGATMIFLAAWLGYQTYLLYRDWKQGALQNHALFRDAPAQAAAAPAEAPKSIGHVGLGAVVSVMMLAQFTARYYDHRLGGGGFFL